MTRYYSTQRPFGPGTYPRQDGTESIVNFDGPTFCEEIGREAWGYIEYARPIETHQAHEYELTRAGTSGRVIVGTDDHGKLCAFMEATGDGYKVRQLEKMLAHETSETDEHYGARLSHWWGDTNTLTIDAGGLRALIKYYSEHDTDLEGRKAE